ncbi:MAG: amidohydrolase family protein, partial [Candidatus Woesearchaeota archaeon]
LGTDSETRSVEALVAKAKALKEEGITAYCLTGSYKVPTLTLTGNIARDITFIDEIIGTKVAISDHRSSYPTPNELIKLVSETRRAGMIANKPGIVTIHMGDGKGSFEPLFNLLKKTDIPIFYLRPTHVGRLSLNDQLKFNKLGGYLDYTAIPIETNASRATSDKINQLIINGGRKDKITISSDGNGSFPVWDENDNLISFKKGGLENNFNIIKELVNKYKYNLEDVLPFVTKNIAESLRISNRKGIIQEGADADILLLDEKNIEITDVIALGKHIKNFK